MKNKFYEERLHELEKNQKFDVDINFGEYLAVEQQKSNHKYIYDGFWDKIYYGFLRTLIFFVAPIYNFFTYRLKIKGRKNLRALKKQGAITVSNHVAFFDTLVIKQAVIRRIFFVGASHNNKKGFGGYTIKVLGMLPLSNQFSNQKNLDNAISYYLRNNKLIHFYPEQALWRGYPKIRPFKNGAFHYAVKNQVPVLPIVMLLRQPNKWDKLLGRRFKITLQCLTKIEPDMSLCPKDRIVDLNQKTRMSIIKCAEEFYDTNIDIV